MASSHNGQEGDAFGPGRLVVVTSWGSEVSRSDVKEREESSTHLRARSTAGTTDTGSSSIYDGGDKAQLKTSGRHIKEQPSQGHRRSPTEQNHLISHAGPPFQESAGPLDRSSTLDIDPRDDDNGDELSEDSFTDLVFRSFHHHESRDKRFLPYDKLDQIVTKNRVHKELRSCLSCSDSQVKAYRDQIWGTSSLPITQKDPVDEPSSAHTDQTTRRKLFTILALMDKLPLILRFIELKIYDRHLPFTFNGRNQKRVSVTYTLEGTTASTEVFRDWKRGALDQFDTFQWQLLTPFFSFTSKPRHYVLSDDVILPFNDKNGGVSPGGFGEVRKITIHHAHYHDSQSNTKLYQGADAESPPLALKKLWRSAKSKKDFARERENHKKIPHHPTLIRLLASYEWRGDYYLLFPWANGNLLNFWEIHPSLAQSDQHPELIFWFSKQCLSLAEGLEAIHNPGSYSANGLAPLGAKAHGRHGDLKPHNILWFKEDDEGVPSFGQLKYCDFGLSAFHRTISMQENPDDYARSVTYMAPERDAGYDIGPSYDIFSLGCVLLEFVTWYIHGWESVKTFANGRAHDDEDNPRESIQMDSFFHVTYVHTGPDGKRMPKLASMKKSVQNEFDQLRNHPRCVDYLVDLLDLIQDKMIRMGPEKRVVAKDLVSQLSALDRHCRTDQNYARKRTKKSPARAGTALSHLVGSSARSTVCFYSTAEECTTNAVHQIPTDESTCRDNIAHEQEPPTNPNAKPAVLRGESTLTQTKSPDTDNFNGEQPRENHLLQGSLEPRAATSREWQNTSFGPEDMTAANSFVSSFINQESDSEREPLLKRPSQEVEWSWAPGEVWSTICSFICCS